ncbi:hypothetical protein C8P63_110128 [Melghirimyces profundicolus]|uniref:Uncharacterized protein n=1 Tax=Melghirimyces profundicolus TaxID=1242148 RepID=A0A2T6BV87_9BACL|nr:hypothetical protein [Melghirimyces profundicolus]PTX59983.1 hypothetical protein C8P63_110128 [Melghirimyces profundicolus]
MGNPLDLEEGRKPEKGRSAKTALMQLISIPVMFGLLILAASYCER